VTLLTSRLRTRSVPSNLLRRSTYVIDEVITYDGVSRRGLMMWSGYGRYSTSFNNITGSCVIDLHEHCG